MSNTVVQTNVLALNAHRNIGIVSNRQSRGSQRLSSGFRINSAADDAAGLAISEKMRSQIRGLDQASRNAQDGISLIQTAEGAMSTVNEMVNRIRELVVQAANDTNVHDDARLEMSDRQRIQDEINQLMDEIDATTLRTEFNTRTLLDGSLARAVLGGTPDAAAMVAQREAFIAEHLALPENQAMLENALNNAINANTAVNDARTSAALALGSANAAALALASGVSNLQNLQNTYEAAAARLAAAQEAMGTTPLSLPSAVAQLNSVIGSLNSLMAGAISAFAANAQISGAVGNATAGAVTGVAGFAAASTITEILAAASAGDLSQASAALVATNITQRLENLFLVTSGGSSWNGFEVIPNTSNFGELDGATAIANAFASINDMLNDTAWTNAMAALDIALTGGPSVLVQAEFNAAATAFALASAAFHAVDITNLQDENFAAQVNLISANAAVSAAIAAVDADAAQATVIGQITQIFELTQLDAMMDEWVAQQEADGGGNTLWFQIGANAGQGINLNIESVRVRDLIDREGVTGQVQSVFDRIDAQYEDGRITPEQQASRTARLQNLLDSVEGGNRGIEFLRTEAAAGGPVGAGVLNESGETLTDVLSLLDIALAHTTEQRSRLGAVQNRLEFTIQNLDIASENLSASESRIRDADMALEMMRFTQANVLQQAAMSMLAQANQAPMQVLQLLG